MNASSGEYGLPRHCHGYTIISSAEIIAVPRDESLNSFFKLRFRGKTSQSQKQRRIGEGDWNIALLHRHEIALGPQSGRGLDGGDEIHEHDRHRRADIDDPPGREGRKAVFGQGRRSSLHRRRRMAEQPEHRFDEIVDVCEIAAHISVIVNVEGAALEKRGGKFEKRHVRAAPGAVDREKSQHCDRDFEEMAVGMGHLLVRLLRGGIERQGMIGPVRLAKRDLRVGPIDRGCRSHQRVRRRRMAHQFQEIEGSGEIGVEIGARIIEAVAHSRLRGEMIDRIESGAINAGKRGAILEHGLMAGKARVLQQYLMAAQLEVAVVVGRKPIEADDFMAFVEKTAGHVKTYEAGAAGDENTHCSRDRGEGV